MFVKRKNKRIIAFGYVKEEDGIYTAICVNMGLFGQGKTPEQALKKVIKAVVSYVSYVLEKYPNESDKFLNRPAPAHYIEEYKQGIKSLKKLTELKYRPRTEPYSTFLPVRNFAEKISFAEAH